MQMIHHINQGRQQRLWTTLVALVLPACTSPVEPLPDEKALIQTNASGYTVTHSDPYLYVDVPFTFTNATGSTVYLVNCGGAFSYWLERYEDGRWQLAWSPVLAACLSPPIVIEPGAQLEGVFGISGAVPDTNARPIFDRSDLTGVYRIVIDALSSYQDRLPFGEKVPLAYRVSNRFQLGH